MLSILQSTTRRLDLVFINLNLVVYQDLFLVLEQCIEGSPLHKHANKLQSGKDLKVGTKAVIGHRFERRGKAQGAFTYQPKVVHSYSMLYKCSS